LTTSDPVPASDSGFSSNSGVARRWTVIAAGLLVLALALVVLFTGPRAFLSPIALVVVAAIGLAALLFQLRFRHDLPEVRSPLWLNILGLLCATASLLADYLHLTRSILELVAFGAVVCFGISGSLILHAIRRHARSQPPSQAEPAQTE
jgi:drug/metabolite transporter (DMT)-like permease